MRTSDNLPKSADPVEARYALLRRWRWAGVAAVLVGLAVTLTGIVSGQGVLGIPWVLCGFLGAMTALGGMAMAIWRGVIESDHTRAPRPPDGSGRR